MAGKWEEGEGRGAFMGGRGRGEEGAGARTAQAWSTCQQRGIGERGGHEQGSFDGRRKGKGR